MLPLIDYFCVGQSITLLDNYQLKFNKIIMQPQQQVVVHAMTTQQPAYVQAISLPEEIFHNRQKILLRLGVAEIIFGLIMMAFGIYTYFQFNTWQSIWIGVVVSSTGSMGVRAGGPRSTLFLINTHMGFSIVGAIASILLAYLTGVAAYVSIQVPSIYVVMAIMSFISSVSAIVLLVSASYGCCSNPLGCCGGSCERCCGQQVFVSDLYQQQTMYENTTQAVQVQGQVMYDPRSMNGTYGSPMPPASTNQPEKNYSFNTQYSTPPAHLDA